jgi:hypothetical protein
MQGCKEKVVWALQYKPIVHLQAMEERTGAWKIEEAKTQVTL